ncbi:uncharacterized protein LOC109539584 isoform X1 [Dendroctonus ponderosae]|uniref:F-box domain-containing protein n=2 Tax=Dendroctonus ponderosae TaxID=77166 RepID=A0AAR5PPN8_DENPD|nr:uncharacterized protein LOC109539584 isoform X1 [Dendroctonus ponderosae]KAH1009273.1 hypothetical protein HUJ04_001651 [Dendroctonus ponderosae]
MDSGGWVVDENDEAMFIDIDQPKEKCEKNYSRWNELPDLLLEKVFSYLTIKERYYASCVCRNWHRTFYLPYVWRQFILEDHTLTRSKFNYYLGWQYVLDHLRTSLCLQTIGKNIKKLIIKPMLNFSNLYEFMNIMSWFIEQHVENDPMKMGVGSNILYLKFTFPCNMTTRDDIESVRLFGTGGKLLAGLKRLMGNFPKLQTLELIDLMLEPCEAQFLLDEVCQTCCLTLRKLSLINVTKTPYQVLHVGVFLNLFELHISPQNLGDDLVELLGFTHLKHLHIVQNRYTTDEGFVKPIMSASWKKVRSMNKGLGVHLEVESNKFKTVVWQEGAPVRSILYDSPHIGAKVDVLMNTIDYFKQELRTYGHLNIPRFHMPKQFCERNDENFLMLVRSCKFLSTLVITEKISTSTVLLLAYSGRNLKWLHVRGNAVVQKCDWPKSPEWSEEFYSWLKFNSSSYELVEKEVSQMFGYNWKFLRDKAFKMLEVNLHDY